MRRDRGFTLTEIVLAVALVGILTIAVAAAITTVLNSEDGVGHVVGEARDEQQLTNFFVGDIGAGPYDPAAYVVDPTATPGCAGTGFGAGSNVLQYDTYEADTGHRVRTAYRVENDPDGHGVLDRVVCTDPGTGTFGSATVVNIADLLAPITGTALPVEVDVVEVAGVVESVALGLVREDGSVDRVTAAPRIGPAVAAPASGPCPQNPFDDTDGFLAYVLDSVRLQDGADSYGSIATGTFSWANGARFSMGPSRKNDEWSLPGYTPADMVALYVHGGLDWASSAGMLELNSGGMITVGDFSGSAYDNGSLGSNQTRVVPSPGPATAYVFNQSVGQRSGSNPVLRPSSPLDMTTAFSAITTSSRQLLGLPGGCPQSNHLTLLGQNGVGSYPGSGAAWVSFTAGNVNVMNVTMAQLRGITQWNQSGTAQPGVGGTQLVINVVDAGAVDFDAPILGLQNYPKHVMYNFPRATSITVPAGQTLWGSIVAPTASLTANGNDIRGGVIARSLVLTGGVLDVDREYAGVFPWS